MAPTLLGCLMFLVAFAAPALAQSPCADIECSGTCVVEDGVPICKPAKPIKNCTKDMLEQVSNINGSWRPIVGNSLYTVQRKSAVVIVVRMYDTNKTDADPQETDLQALFLKTKHQCKLVAITFSPIDVTKYIDLLVE